MAAFHINRFRTPVLLNSKSHMLFYFSTSSNLELDDFEGVTDKDMKNFEKAMKEQSVVLKHCLDYEKLFNIEHPKIGYLDTEKKLVEFISIVLGYANKHTDNANYLIKSAENN
jgi:hypothetical protein